MQAIQRGSQFFNRTPATTPPPPPPPNPLLDHLILKRRPNNRDRQGEKGSEGDQMCWFCSDKDEKRRMTPFFFCWQVNVR